MIKNYLTLLLSVIGLWTIGQNHKMVLHKNGTSLYEVKLSEIDSVTFEVIATNDDTAGTFTDSRDGNVYKYVTIGNQVWMAENLKYLPKVNRKDDGSEDTAGSYYYVYGYDGTDVTAAKATSNYTTYGVLYNWDAAMNGESSSTNNPSNVQGVCPTGWHLPSDSEWTQLTDYVKNDGHSGTEGSALKSVTGWTNDTDNTDNYGFTALPGGSRYSNGTFGIVGHDGYWCTATEFNATGAWLRYMFNYYSYVSRGIEPKAAVGYSVRCVRD